MRALIFDLDGTLIDTVYAHVFAWQRALAEVGLPIDGWRIHRRIGMSGGLFTRAVAREAGRPLSDDEAETIQKRHGTLFRELMPDRRPYLAPWSSWRSFAARASRTGSQRRGVDRRSMRRSRR